MLGIFSGKSQHPLVDAKSAKELFERLNQSDPLEVIDEIDSWLESTSRDDLMKPQRRVEVMFQLDGIGASAASKLVREYLLLSANDGRKSQKLWVANHKYWRQLADSYRYLIEQFEADKKLREDMKSSLPPMYARLLRAYGGSLKWDQLRYGPIEPELWADAGRIYLQGEKNRWLDKVVDIGGRQTNIGTEYLRLLTFHAASMDRLKTGEIELAEQLLFYFLPGFSLTRQIRPENVYWIDAGKPLPPTRLAKLPEVTPTLRFFSTANALSAIETTRSDISVTQQLPQHFGLDQSFDLAEVNAVLQHLSIFCAPQPPMRSHTRHQVKSWTKAVDGLRPIIDAIRGSEIACGTWEVEDVSHGGVRAQVVLEANEGVGVGSLVAMCPNGGDNWLIGVVRRFSRGSHTKGSLGIETLSRAPRTVDFDNGCEGLLLDYSLQAGGAAVIVLPPDDWQALHQSGRLATLDLDGERFRLRPLEMQQSGKDYVFGRFWVDAAGA